MGLKDDTTIEAGIASAWTHYLAEEKSALQADLAVLPETLPDTGRLRAYHALTIGDAGQTFNTLKQLPWWERSEVDCLYLDAAFRAARDLEAPNDWSEYIDYLLSHGNVAAAYPLIKSAPKELRNSLKLDLILLRLRHLAGFPAQVIVQEANELLRRGCQDVELFLTLGQALINLHAYDSAQHALDMGRRISPHHPYLNFQSARAAEYLGNLQQALTYYLLATDHSGGYPASALGAARLLKISGNKDDAQRCLALASQERFLPLVKMLFALTPDGENTPPHLDELEIALSPGISATLDPGLFFSDFCGYPGFQDFLRLPEHLGCQFAQKLLTLFPALGYCRVHDGNRRVSDNFRLGLLLPELGEECDEQLALSQVQAWGANNGYSIFVFFAGSPIDLPDSTFEGLSIRGVNLVLAQQKIFDASLDALLLVNLHRDRITTLLGFSRLAPLQIAVTSTGQAFSGLTIDATYPLDRITDALSAAEKALSTSEIRLPSSFSPAKDLRHACAESGGSWKMLREEANFSINSATEIDKQGVRSPTSITLRNAQVCYARLSDIDVHHGEPAFLSPNFSGVAHNYSFLHDMRRITSLPPIHRWLYSWRLMEEEVGRHFLLQKRAELCKLPKAIILRCKAASNYFHWLFDGLPQLEAILNDHELATWPILIDQGLHPNLEAALRHLIGERQVLRQPFGTCIRVDDAVIPCGGNRIPLSLRTGARFVESDFSFCPQSIAFLRHRITAKSVIRPERRIYLKRSGSCRKLVNESAIERLFVQQGFELADTALLSLEEQIVLFSQAKVIAGPTGASFSNILFAPPECQIILFTHEACGHYFFSNLAGAIGQRFSAVIGFSIPGTHIEDHQRDFFLPLSFARQALARL